LYERTRKAIGEGEIGEVQLLSVEFGASCAQDLPRIRHLEMGGGALMDMGCYTVMYANFVFGGEKPQKITANAKKSAEGGSVSQVTLRCLSFLFVFFCNFVSGISVVW